MREIQFKNDSQTLRDQFNFSLYPKLRDRVKQYDAIAELMGAPPTVVTCINRNVEENAKAGGVPTSLHIKKMGEEFVRAVDLRNTHYSELERRTLAGVLHVWATKEDDFDVMTIEHGTGPHFHLEWEGA